MSKRFIIKATQETVSLVEEAKGWITVRLADGTNKKFRAKDLEDAPAVGGRAPAPAGLIGGERVTQIKGATVDLSHYFLGDTRTESGRRTVDCNDDVAARLRGMPLADVYVEAASTLNTDVKALQKQYAHLNTGMQRMNLGNRIRGALAAQAKAATSEAAKAGAKEPKAKPAKEAKAAAKTTKRGAKEVAGHAA